MSDFVAACKIADLAPGSMTWTAVGREWVLVANVEGAIYALSDVCGHLRAPLSRGRLVGYSVECPLHFACFDVRTGALIDGPVATNVPTYEVRVDDGTVYVSSQPRVLGPDAESKTP